jgi:hypothetical protein
VIADPEIEAVFPPCSTDHRDGVRHAACVSSTTRAAIRNPLWDAQVGEKFAALAEPVLSGRTGQTGTGALVAGSMGGVRAGRCAPQTGSNRSPISA